MDIPRDRRPRLVRGAVIAAAGLGLIITALPGPARADDSTPTPDPTASTTTAPTEASSAATPSVTPAVTPDVTPTITPDNTVTPSTTDVPGRAAGAEQAPGDPPLTLTVSSQGGAGAGLFYEDIGSFLLQGSVNPARAGQPVAAYWYRASTRTWIRSATGTTDANGGYALLQKVGAVGATAFRTTLGPAPGGSTVSSNQVTVTVRDATIRTNPVASSIDSLRNPTITGAVVPARAGVRVSIDTVVKGTWRSTASGVTAANGTYAISYGYGNGSLARYTYRASYPAANRVRTEASASRAISRVKVLSASVTRTTAAQVAKTYRSGCPVGPSRLRTVSMNFYGYDNRMHRGLVIVRKDLADDTIRGFNAALKAGFHIAKMNNPNVYGGNDPRQMAANNTSGFNCRKVVGNPYRQSPHSYGIALDVNTVQNPYRDGNGKWWPSNGKKYIDRTPKKRGMISKSSTLTKQLKKDKYFWGGRWNPGRDYQHFEKR